MLLSSSILCNNSNCMLWVIKNAGLSPIRTKLELLIVSSLFYLSDFFNAQVGTGTSYACAMSSFGIQMFILIQFLPTKYRRTKCCKTSGVTEHLRELNLHKISFSATDIYLYIHSACAQCMAWHDIAT